MYTDFMPAPRRRQTGITLVEVIVFIVIISVGIAGLLGVMNVTTRSSADPMIRKQALAIAESLMEEIQLQPFTYCAIEDATAATATGAFVGANGCTATVQGLGAAGKTRYAEDNRFNNVGNYQGFVMNGVLDITGTVVGGLGAFNAVVAITQEAQGGIAAADSLRINVTVTPPNGDAITLTGYRFRYAPRAVP